MTAQIVVMAEWREHKARIEWVGRSAGMDAGVD